MNAPVSCVKAAPILFALSRSPAANFVPFLYSMPIFRKPFLKNIVSKTREMPEGLWTKCPSCSEVIHNLALEENLRICPKCEHHFTMGSKERIASLIDEGTFEETDANMTSVDTLEFKALRPTRTASRAIRKKPGLPMPLSRAPERSTASRWASQ